ncbi:MAG: hypothetical protein VZR02_03870 [Lachnospiraceae bacterium]|nr:hypothetical protein [Lachnospiraceae bacterium]
MAKLSDGVKRLLLAGVGAVATTADKTEEIFNDLVKKGEITVDEGKELNEELKHTMKKKEEEKKAKREETKEDDDKIIDVEPEEVRDAKEKKDGVEIDPVAMVAGLSAEGLEKLRAALDEAEARTKKAAKDLAGHDEE